MSFFSELKRRNVYRVAALYIIVGWVALQVVDLFMSFMPLPEWTSRLVFVLLAAGFPVALVLAWAIELTPEGIRLEQSGDDVQAPGRRSDLLIYAVLAVVVGAGAFSLVSRDSEDPESMPEIRSIVVLPLDNLMADPGQAYFVEGMHEALITELSKVDALRVISRTSAMKFLDSNLSVPEIGRELGVDAVIEGSVLRAGDTVRVTAQLIDARSDRHLWADNFDRELTDILALYADVTREIVDSVRITLTPEEAARLMTVKPVDAGAYELYLRGSYACDQWTPGDMRDGIEFMRNAISIDPDKALYHAGLAQCLQYASFYDYVRPIDIIDEANTAARRAVELDDNLSEAWTAFAAVRYYLDYDFLASSLALERAIALSPSNARARTHYSWQLGEAGRTAEALRWADEALKLDPLSPNTRTTTGQALYLNREFDAALTEYQALVDMDPSGPTSYFYVAWALEQQGRHAAAIDQHRRAIELSDGAPLYLAGLGYSLAIAGESEEAREIAERLTLAAEEGQAEPVHLAIVHAGLGNVNEAIGWLEKAYEARNSHMLYIRQDAKFDPLRDDERFVDLMRRMGWPTP
jgi:TolB-like protein/tetratricopeptide (TPR) repeat protein